MNDDRDEDDEPIANAPRDNYERRKAEAKLGELAPDVLKLVPQLSDEEWARRDAEVAADRAALELKTQAQPRLDALLEMGFPKRSIDIVRAGVAAEPAIERMRPHLATSEIVVISGTKGCGKTVAATWWAVHRSERVHFVRASSFARSSRYEDRELRAKMLGHTLVLDDLGAEYVDAKGSFLTDLDELIDVFYGDVRALVITTNVLAVERPAEGAPERYPFAERYGERIADRLRECGRWISLKGESLRQRKGTVQPPPKAAT